MQRFVLHWINHTILELKQRHEMQRSKECLVKQILKYSELSWDTYAP
jgi:hypothetical protein